MPIFIHRIIVDKLILHLAFIKLMLSDNEKAVQCYLCHISLSFENFVLCPKAYPGARAIGAMLPPSKRDCFAKKKIYKP